VRLVTGDEPDPGTATDELASFRSATSLRSAVLEVEKHVNGDGWDQPGRLFALVATAELLRAEPDLADQLGLDAPDSADGLTPVEQEVDAEHASAVESLLPQIGWPDSVAGAAVVLERVVLPPEAEDAVPAAADEASEFAAAHPRREDVRIVVGALRSGDVHCVIRMRSHDDDQQLLQGEDLVPGLAAALRETFEAGSDAETGDQRE
jgi:hypothetical protein